MNSLRLSSRQHAASHARRTIGAIAASALLCSGCHAAVDAYAPDPADAHDAAAQVAAGVQHRFNTPTRDSRYEHGRMRIARYALAPSKVANDSIWSSVRGSRRELLAQGQMIGTQYRFRSAATVALPARLGDSRHSVVLDTLPNGEWRWSTQVDHAIGRATPEAIRSTFAAMLRSAERPSDVIRADYRQTMPRTAERFARLATLDSVRTVRLADGSTSVTLGVRLHPERIESEFPDFARYLRKYLSPSTFRFALRDHARLGAAAGDHWFSVDGDGNLITLRFRTRNGALQPFDGPLRAMPDTLALHVDVSAKFGPFTVGVREMRGQFVFLRAANEVGWDMTFDQEPEWDLPPIAGRMVRSPLQRPFQGDGVQARLSVKQLANGQSVVHRRTVTDVRESTLLRWLGNLGFTAMDDFAGRVELEEARFLAEAMRAMRTDIGALPDTVR